MRILSGAFAWLALGASALHVAPAAAAWPERNVTVVVPFPAGGVADTLARLFSERFQSKLGQSFVVENVTGASGVIASNRVRRSDPDGYTLYFATTPQLSIIQHVQKLDFDPQEAFVGVSPGAINAFVFTVSVNTGIKSLQELIDRARKNPETITFGTAGPLTFSHMTTQIFARVADIKLRAVAYRGLAPAMQDLIAGHINLMSASPNELSSILDQGKVTPLAITGPVISKALPKLPVLKTIVPNAPDLVTWQGLVAPKGTPDEAIRKLSGVMMDAARDPAFIARLDTVGLTPIVQTPEEFKTFLVEENNLWKRLVKDYDLTPTTSAP